MKKLVKVSAFILTVLLVVEMLASALYNASPAKEELMNLDETEKFLTMPASIDVAVLGSSHAEYGIRYGPSDKSFFNFALASQEPTYDLAMLHQFKEQLHKGSVVVFVLSYSIPYTFYSEEEFKEKQTRYYRILDYENMVRPDPVQYVLHRYFTVLGIDPEILLRTITSYIPTNEENMESAGPISRDELAEATKVTVGRHWSYMEPGYPDGNPEQLEAIHQLLTECMENDWQAVLVTTPFLKSYSEAFPAGVLDDFRQKVEGWVTEFDIPYFDYSHDAEFTKDLSLFFDVDHLNLAGDRAFEERLWSDLRAQGLL